MKKILIITAVLVISAFVFGAAGLAYAQSQLPEGEELTDVLPRMFGGRGRGMENHSVAFPRAALQQDLPRGDGPLHDYIVGAVAAALEMNPEELTARLEGGETMWTIAQERGISQEDFRTLMADAMKSALAQAVEDGVITQEQADFMSQRMGGMGAKAYGRSMAGKRGPGIVGDSPLQPYMQESVIETFAGPLNTTAEDLKARLEAGEKIRQIALDAGLTQDQIVDLMESARQAAIEDATQAGLFSEEWAERMVEKMGARQQGMGARRGPGGAGSMQGPGCRGDR